MAALKRINYNSFISAEILPLPEQYQAEEMTIGYLGKICGSS